MEWLVILAGGAGSRLNSSRLTPKPMVVIEQNPMIASVIQMFEFAEVKNIVLCLGFGKEAVIEYFEKTYTPAIGWQQKRSHNLIFFENETKKTHIYLLNTGENNQTGSRLKQGLNFLKNLGATNTFVSYCDGFSDINFNDFYKKFITQKANLSLVVTTPKIQYGVIEFNKNHIATKFTEKPQANYFVSAGFFAMNVEYVISFLNDEESLNFEETVLPKMIQAGNVSVFVHTGFWQTVDNLKDINTLREQCPLKNLQL